MATKLACLMCVCVLLAATQGEEHSYTQNITEMAHDSHGSTSSECKQGTDTLQQLVNATLLLCCSQV